MEYAAPWHATAGRIWLLPRARLICDNDRVRTKLITSIRSSTLLRARMLMLYMAAAAASMSMAASAAGCGGSAKPPVDTPPTPEPGRGLDARLTGYAYPFEVHILPIQAQGQSLEMAYMDVKPEGPPRGTVLLLHGKNFSGAYWERTMRGLVDLGFRVIAPDQIGFGKSSKPVSYQYSLHAMAAQTVALLDALAAERVVAVGHSMGGMLATRLALDAPARVAALALVNPIGLEDWQRWVPYAPVEALYQQARAQQPEDVRSYMRDAYFAGQWKPAYDPLLTIQVGWIEGPDADQMAMISALTSDMIFTQPVLYHWPDVSVPTMLIIGQRDRTAIGRDRAPEDVRDRLGDYPALGRIAAATIPDATLIRLEGVGHVPQFEAFEPYFAALSRFAAARTAPAAAKDQAKDATAAPAAPPSP